VRPLAEVLSTLEMPVRENQKCPFAALGGPNPHAAEADTASATDRGVGAVTKAGAPISAAASACPFPFILLHEPTKAMVAPYCWYLAAAFAGVIAVLIATFN
jgi:hypothetical protein